MIQNVLHYLFMEGLEQETANKIPETEQLKAKSEILRFINGLGKPIQSKIDKLALDAQTKTSLVTNLVKIGYEKTYLNKSDFYVKKALLLEGIKGNEDYSYTVINNLIAKFEKNGVRGTTENQRKLIQFYLYERGFYPEDYVKNKNISLFDACDGAIGPNTKTAIANLRDNRNPSQAAIAILEGEMTSDSIRKPSELPPRVAAVPQQVDMTRSPIEPASVPFSPVEKITHPNPWSAKLGKLCDQYVKVANKQVDYNKVRDELGLVSGMFYENAKNQFAGIEKGGATMGKNPEYRRYLNHLESVVGIQKNFLYAMMIVESKGNSNARNTANGSDCRGLFQLNNRDFGAFLGNPIMEAIAAAMTVRFGYYNPSCNPIGAHDVAAVLTRYNSGGKKQVIDFYGLDFNKYATLNQTTRQHIAKVYYVMSGLSDTPQKEAMRDFTEQLLRAGGYGTSIFDNTFGKSPDAFAKFCDAERWTIAGKYNGFEPKEMTRMHTAWEKYRYNVDHESAPGFQFERDAVFVGDSITQGYSSYHQMNASFSVQGKTSDKICGMYADQAISTIQKYRAQDVARGINTKKMVLMCGTNDLMGNPDIAHIISSNVDAFVKKCRANNIQPVLCTLPISPSIATKVEIYNAQLRTYAQQNGVQLIEFGDIKNVPAGKNTSAVNRFETGKVRVHPLPGTYKEMAQRVKQQLS